MQQNGNIYTAVVVEKRNTFKTMCTAPSRRKIHSNYKN